MHGRRSSVLDLPFNWKQPQVIKGCRQERISARQRPGSLVRTFTGLPRKQTFLSWKEPAQSQPPDVSIYRLLIRVTCNALWNKVRDSRSFEVFRVLRASVARFLWFPQSWSYRVPIVHFQNQSSPNSPSSVTVSTSSLSFGEPANRQQPLSLPSLRPHSKPFTAPHLSYLRHPPSSSRVNFIFHRCWHLPTSAVIDIHQRLQTTSPIHRHLLSVFSAIVVFTCRLHPHLSSEFSDLTCR